MIPYPRLLVVLALAMAMSGGLWFWTHVPTDDELPPPVASMDDLSAVPDQDLEPRVLHYLAQQFAGQGAQQRSWRTGRSSACQLWAMAWTERTVSDFGCSGTRRLQAADPELPTFDEARSAYQAYGLAEAANALDALDLRSTEEQADSNQTQLGLARLSATLARPDIRLRRLAFIKAHLAELADPWPAND